MGKTKNIYKKLMALTVAIMTIATMGSSIANASTDFDSSSSGLKEVPYNGGTNTNKVDVYKKGGYKISLMYTGEKDKNLYEPKVNEDSLRNDTKALYSSTNKTPLSITGYGVPKEYKDEKYIGQFSVASIYFSSDETLNTEIGIDYNLKTGIYSDINKFIIKRTDIDAVISKLSNKDLKIGLGGVSRSTLANQIYSVRIGNIFDSTPNIPDKLGIKSVEITENPTEEEKIQLSKNEAVIRVFLELMKSKYKENASTLAIINEIIEKGLGENVTESFALVVEPMAEIGIKNYNNQGKTLRSWITPNAWLLANSKNVTARTFGTEITNLRQAIETGKLTYTYSASKGLYGTHDCWSYFVGRGKEGNLDQLNGNVPTGAGGSGKNINTDTRPFILRETLFSKVIYTGPERLTDNKDKNGNNIWERYYNGEGYKVGFGTIHSQDFLPSPQPTEDISLTSSASGVVSIKEDSIRDILAVEYLGNKAIIKDENISELAKQAFDKLVGLNKEHNIIVKSKTAYYSTGDSVPTITEENQTGSYNSNSLEDILSSQQNGLEDIKVANTVLRLSIASFLSEGGSILNLNTQVNIESMNMKNDEFGMLLSLANTVAEEKNTTEDKERAYGIIKSVVGNRLNELGYSGTSDNIVDSALSTDLVFFSDTNTGEMTKTQSGSGVEPKNNSTKIIVNDNNGTKSIEKDGNGKIVNVLNTLTFTGSIRKPDMERGLDFSKEYYNMLKRGVKEYNLETDETGEIKLKNVLESIKVLSEQWDSNEYYLSKSEFIETGVYTVLLGNKLDLSIRKVYLYNSEVKTYNKDGTIRSHIIHSENNITDDNDSSVVTKGMLTAQVSEILTLLTDYIADCMDYQAWYFSNENPNEAGKSNKQLIEEVNIKFQNELKFRLGSYLDIIHDNRAEYSDQLTILANNAKHLDKDFLDLLRSRVNYGFMLGKYLSIGDDANFSGANINIDEEQKEAVYGILSELRSNGLVTNPNVTLLNYMSIMGYYNSQGLMKNSHLALALSTDEAVKKVYENETSIPGYGLPIEAANLGSIYGVSEQFNKKVDTNIYSNLSEYNSGLTNFLNKTSIEIQGSNGRGISYIPDSSLVQANVDYENFGKEFNSKNYYTIAASEKVLDKVNTDKIVYGGVDLFGERGEFLDWTSTDLVMYRIVQEKDLTSKLISYSEYVKKINLDGSYAVLMIDKAKAKNEGIKESAYITEVNKLSEKIRNLIITDISVKISVDDLSKKISEPASVIFLRDEVKKETTAKIKMEDNQMKSMFLIYNFVVENAVESGKANNLVYKMEDENKKGIEVSDKMIKLSNTYGPDSVYLNNMYRFKSSPTELWAGAYSYSDSDLNSLFRVIGRELSRRDNKLLDSYDALSLLSMVSPKIVYGLTEDSRLGWLYRSDSRMTALEWKMGVLNEDGSVNNTNKKHYDKIKDKIDNMFNQDNTYNIMEVVENKNPKTDYMFNGKHSNSVTFNEEDVINLIADVISISSVTKNYSAVLVSGTNGSDKYLLPYMASEPGYFLDVEVSDISKIDTLREVYRGDELLASRLLLTDLLDGTLKSNNNKIEIEDEINSLANAKNIRTNNIKYSGKMSTAVGLVTPAGFVDLLVVGVDENGNIKKNEFADGYDTFNSYGAYYRKAFAFPYDKLSTIQLNEIDSTIGNVRYATILPSSFRYSDIYNTGNDRLSDFLIYSDYLSIEEDSGKQIMERLKTPVSISNMEKLQKHILEMEKTKKDTIKANYSNYLSLYAQSELTSSNLMGFVPNATGATDNTLNFILSSNEAMSGNNPILVVLVEDGIRVDLEKVFLNTDGEVIGTDRDIAYTTNLKLDYLDTPVEIDGDTYKYQYTLTETATIPSYTGTTVFGSLRDWKIVDGLDKENPEDTIDYYLDSVEGKFKGTSELVRPIKNNQTIVAYYTVETQIKQLNVLVSKDGLDYKVENVKEVRPKLDRNPLSTGDSYRATLEETYNKGKLRDWKVVDGVNISTSGNARYYSSLTAHADGLGSPATPIKAGQTILVFYEVEAPDVELVVIEKNKVTKDGKLITEDIRVNQPINIKDKLEYNSKDKTFEFSFITPTNAENFKGKVVRGISLTGNNYNDFTPVEQSNAGPHFERLADKQTIVVYYEINTDSNTGNTGGYLDGNLVLEENEIAKGIDNVLDKASGGTFKITASFPRYPKNWTDSMYGSGHGTNYMLNANKTFNLTYKNNAETGTDGILDKLDSDVVYTGNKSELKGFRTDPKQFSSGLMTGTQQGTATDDKEYKPDYNITIFRGKTSDKITLAEYYYNKNGKDSSYNTLTSELNIDSANSKTKARISSSGWSGKSYNVGKIEFVLDSLNSDTTIEYYGESICSGHDRWVGTGTDSEGNPTGYWDSYTINHGIAPNTELKATLKDNSLDLDVAVNNYVGSKNTGIVNSKDTKSTIEFKSNGTEFKNSKLSQAYGYSINTSRSMKFNPYIEMKYSTASNPDNFINAYALSEHQSEIKNSDYVDVGFIKGTENSLVVDSSQWNSSKRSVEALKGTKNALPAGAAFSLKADPSKSYIGLKVWQTYVEDSEQAVVTNYNYFNKASADSRRNEFLNTFKEAIESYDVVQYIAQGIMGDTNAEKNKADIVSKGIALDTKGVYGNKITTIFGNKVNNDSKYYLKLGTTGGADTGKIDIVNETIETITWKIASDVKGKVTVYKNGAEVNSIAKHQDYAELVGTNKELIELDSKTKLITNFLLSIDRNVGKDNWYNEAMDGVSVVVTSYLYEVGFKNASTRSAILDTALSGKLEGRADMFNYGNGDKNVEKEKVRSTFFRTSPTSSLGKYQGYGKGFLGTFGDDKVIIQLDDIENLLSSKVFYIPNVTVQDLINN